MAMICNMKVRQGLPLPSQIRPPMTMMTRAMSFAPVKKTCTLAASVVSKELTIASVTVYEMNKYVFKKVFTLYLLYASFRSKNCLS